MNLTEIMQKRKSIRKYQQKVISEEILQKILTAGKLAPTSRNLKPCEFLLIRDKDVLQKLSKAKKTGAGFVSDADTAIVVIADSQKSDTWVEDSAIAMTYMMLSAEEQELGCCWVQMHLRKSESGRDAEAVIREILRLSENYRIVGLLSLGIK